MHNKGGGGYKPEHPELKTLSADAGHGAVCMSLRSLSSSSVTYQGSALCCAYKAVLWSSLLPASLLLFLSTQGEQWSLL